MPESVSRSTRTRGARHVEEVVARSLELLLALVARRHPNRLDGMDAEWLDDGYPLTVHSPMCTLPGLMTTQPLSDNEFLFTSESVTEGHPDKMADQISDGVLDAVMAEDPQGRVACETLVNTGLVVVSGEITTDMYVDIPKIARETIRKIGYSGGRLRVRLRQLRGDHRDRRAVARHRAGRRHTRTRRAPTRPTTTSSTWPARATRA